MSKLKLKPARFLVLLILATLALFILHFQPFNQAFPLPKFNSKYFFNYTFSQQYNFSNQVLNWQNLKAYPGNPVNLLWLKLLPFPGSLKLLYLISFMVLVLGSWQWLKLINPNHLGINFISLLSLSFSGLWLVQFYNLYQFQSLSLLPWVFWQSYKLIKKVKLTNVLGLLILIGLVLVSVDKTTLQPHALNYFYSLSPALSHLYFLSGGLVLWLTVIRALISLIRSKSLTKNRQFLVCLAGTVFSLLMLFVRYSPLYIIYLFPPFNYLKTPLVMTGVLATFGLGLLSLSLSQLKTKLTLLKSLFIFGLIAELIFINLNQQSVQTSQQVIAQLEQDYPLIQNLSQTKTLVWFLEAKTSGEIYPLEPNNYLLWQIKMLQDAPAEIYANIFYTDSGLYLAPAVGEWLKAQTVKYLFSPLAITNLEAINANQSVLIYQIF